MNSACLYNKPTTAGLLCTQWTVHSDSIFWVAKILYRLNWTLQKTMKTYANKGIGQCLPNTLYFPWKRSGSPKDNPVKNLNSDKLCRGGLVSQNLRICKNKLQDECPDDFRWAGKAPFAKVWQLFVNISPICWETLHYYVLTLQKSGF